MERHLFNKEELVSLADEYFQLGLSYSGSSDNEIAKKSFANALVLYKQAGEDFFVNLCNTFLLDFLNNKEERTQFCSYRDDLVNFILDKSEYVLVKSFGIEN